MSLNRFTSLEGLTHQSIKDVKQYPDDFKLKVALHYLQTDNSYGETARRFKWPGHKAVWEWVKNSKPKKFIPLPASNHTPALSEASFKWDIV